MRKDEEHRPARRLFQHLEDRIGGTAVHLVCGIDDDDAPALAARRLPEELSGAPHLIHSNGRLEFAALGIERPGDVKQVVRGARDDLPKCRRRGVRIDHTRRRLLRPRMRQHMVRKAEGQRRLAYSLRPLDQDRMVALPGTIGTREKILRRLVAEEMDIRSRRHRPVQHQCFAFSAQTLPVSLARVA